MTYPIHGEDDSIHTQLVIAESEEKIMQEVAKNTFCLGEFGQEESDDLSAQVILRVSDDNFRCGAKIKLTSKLARYKKLEIELYKRLGARKNYVGIAFDHVGLATEENTRAVGDISFAVNNGNTFMHLAMHDSHKQQIEGAKPYELDPQEIDVTDTIKQLSKSVSEVINVLHDIEHPTSEEVYPFKIVLPNKGGYLLQLLTNNDELDSGLTQEVEECDAKKKAEETSPKFYPAQVTFEDVVGQEEAVQQLKELAEDFIDPELLDKYGLIRPHAVLLQGKSGVGKTTAATAMANQMKATLHKITVTDILDKWVGEPQKKLRETFAYATENEGFTLLLFDECDGLFAAKSGGNEGVAKSIVAELKTILENMEAKYPNVFAIFAANSIEGFDTALLRPGRIDHVIKFSNPNKNSRQALFSHYIGKYAINYVFGNPERPDEYPDPVNAAALAEETDGMSGAEIKAIVERTRRLRYRQHKKSGQEPPRIRQSDLLAAIHWYKTNQASDV